MCALAVLTMLAFYNPPKGTVIWIPRSELVARRYTKRDIVHGKACCESRGIRCEIAEDK